MFKPKCVFYNTDTTDYWNFYPKEGTKVNLTSIGALFTKKNRLVSTKEIFDEMDENGIDGIKFYYCELEDKNKDPLQDKILNRMKYIKLHFIKDNVFNYLPSSVSKTNLEKLHIFDVQLSEDFYMFLSKMKLKYLRIEH